MKAHVSRNTRADSGLQLRTVMAAVLMAVAFAGLLSGCWWIIVDLPSLPVPIANENNSAPIAKIECSLTTGYAPLSVQFSCTDSLDPDGDDLEALWQFGDATASMDPEVVHTFAAGGTYDVHLVVTDPFGASGIATETVEVLPRWEQTYEDSSETEASGTCRLFLGGDILDVQVSAGTNSTPSASTIGALQLADDLSGISVEGYRVGDQVLLVAYDRKRVYAPAVALVELSEISSARLAQTEPKFVVTGLLATIVVYALGTAGPYIAQYGQTFYDYIDMNNMTRDHAPTIAESFSDITRKGGNVARQAGHAIADAYIVHIRPAVAEYLGLAKEALIEFGEDAIVTLSGYGEAFLDSLGELIPEIGEPVCTVSGLCSNPESTCPVWPCDDSVLPGTFMLEAIGPTANVQVEPATTGTTSTRFIFDGSDSRAGSSGVIHYSWRFEDAEEEVTGARVSHVFASPGEHAVTMRVLDSSLLSDTETVHITVEALPLDESLVTLTLYVHENSTSGSVIQSARIQGADGNGNPFDQYTNLSGYVTITGEPGTWSFTGSKSGYNNNSWSQSITSTSTKHAYITKQSTAVTLTLYVHENSSSGPAIQNAHVQGTDGASSSFDGYSSSIGYLQITGQPGSWSFTVSKSGYESGSWSQEIASTGRRDVFLIKEVESKQLNQIVVFGPSSVDESTSANYTCTAYFSDGTSSDVTGSARWSENSSYTTISNGQLSVGSISSDQTCTVTASYTYNGGTKSASKSVTLKNVPVSKALDRVTISGANEVNESSSADYTCTAYFSDGSNTDVTNSASWSENTSYTTISSGRLTVGSLSSNKTCTVTASYTYNGGIKSATKSVTLRKTSVDIINFPDPDLEDAIRDAIGIPTGDIHNTDLIGLTYLDAGDRSISNLEGIQHCTGLTRLLLSNNQIVDISPLSNLTNLTNLALWGNQIVDISALSSLTNLSQLWLWNNQIVDISPLSNLVNLMNLSIEDNQIVNISPLAGLAAIEMLDLKQNEIVDVSVLSGLYNLYLLLLSENHVIDLSPLSGLTNLEGLWLEANQIVNISALVGLISLDTLALDHNEIVDLSPLSGLTNLESLYLICNEIVDLSPLSGLTNLRGLNLDHNKIIDISPLMGACSLYHLSLCCNQIADINALLGLSNLFYLDLSWNALDLTPGSDDMLSIEVLEGRGVDVFYGAELTTPPDECLALPGFLCVEVD